jgi:hypothetical protein
VVRGFGVWPSHHIRVYLLYQHHGQDDYPVTAPDWLFLAAGLATLTIEWRVFNG